MVHHTAWAAALFASLAVAQSYPPDAVDKLATDSLPKLKEWLAKNPQDGCTFETAARRREWSVTSFRL
jgi:tyrosinase